VRRAGVCVLAFIQGRCKPCATDHGVACGTDDPTWPDPLGRSTIRRGKKLSARHGFVQSWVQGQDPVSPWVRESVPGTSRTNLKITGAVDDIWQMRESEASSFTHACRRWTGKSPRECAIDHREPAREGRRVASSRDRQGSAPGLASSVSYDAARTELRFELSSHVGDADIKYSTPSVNAVTINSLLNERIDKCFAKSRKIFRDYAESAMPQSII
jgi:hypothetical protein